jgi:hypothetical protein
MGVQVIRDWVACIVSRVATNGIYIKAKKCPNIQI